MTSISWSQGRRLKVYKSSIFCIHTYIKSEFYSVFIEKSSSHKCGPRKNTPPNAMLPMFSISYLFSDFTLVKWCPRNPRLCATCQARAEEASWIFEGWAEGGRRRACCQAARSPPLCAVVAVFCYLFQG